MKRFILLALFALAIALCAAPAQSAMSGSTYGVGPHGWDVFNGTWSCTNSMPSTTGGPATSSLTVSRNGAGSQYFRATGQGFDTSGYVAYNAAGKIWYNPAGFADGSYTYETTKQTGSKTVWAGTYYSAETGKTTAIRDTYTFASSTNYTDVTQMNTGGWKTITNLNCTKS